MRVLYMECGGVPNDTVELEEFSEEAVRKFLSYRDDIDLVTHEEIEGIEMYTAYEKDGEGDTFTFLRVKPRG